MTKGTKIFRIIICSLLGLTMLCSAFFAFAMGVHIVRDIMGASYGINVAGVDVTRSNEDDILGDGTVYYDSFNNVLVFQDAKIEYDNSVVYSKIDLMINLVGENKFVMHGDSLPVIHVSDYSLSKDLLIFGDGSLSIEVDGECTDMVGIYANNLRIESDISLAMPNCSNIANGIYSDGSITLSGGAAVTVNNGGGKYCTAVKARNNVDIEHGSTLNVAVSSGSTDICRGLTVGGSLVVWDGASLNVSVDDEAAKMSECISVPGLLRVRDNAKVTASAKKAYGIECYGSMELNPESNVFASSEGEGADLFCCGAIINYGATVNGEVEALGGVHSK